MDIDLPAIDQTHSDRFIDMASRTSRLRVIPQPDGYGQKATGCGDSIELFLSVRYDRIHAISFLIQGCLNTNACANTLADLAEGRNVTDVWQITPADVMDYLETLPAEHTHCAELVVEALHQAVNDYNACRHEPWKRAYRKRQG